MLRKNLGWLAGKKPVPRAKNPHRIIEKNRATLDRISKLEARVDLIILQWLENYFTRFNQILILTTECYFHHKILTLLKLTAASQFFGIGCQLFITGLQQDKSKGIDRGTSHEHPLVTHYVHG